jgi:hypothetical protein
MTHKSLILFFPIISRMAETARWMNTTAAYFYILKLYILLNIRNICNFCSGNILELVR